LCSLDRGSFNWSNFYWSNFNWSNFYWSSLNWSNFYWSSLESPSPGVASTAGSAAEAA
jgi:hypothetical protein